MAPPDELRLQRGQKGALPPAELEFSPFFRPRRAWLRARAARSVLTGAATRSAPRSDGFPPTTHALGVAPAAIAATADLSTACCAQSPQVSAACKKRRVCVRAAMYAAVARRHAAAAAAALPGPHAHVTHDLHRPVSRVVAGRSAVAAPSQRAAECGREGRRAGRTGRNGRRTLAQAVGAGRGASSTFGGVRGARAVLSAAGVAAGRAPRGRPLCSACRCDLAGARLTPFGASGGHETSPDRLGSARRYPMVTLGPAGAWQSVACAMVGVRVPHLRDLPDLEP